MFCAALLELRQRKQAEQLALENEKNLVKSRCELASESGEFVHSDADVTTDEEQRIDICKSIDQNASGDGGEIDDAGDTDEAKNTDDVMEITASADVILSQKNISDTDAPWRLDQLKQAEKLESNLNKAEQREPDALATTTAGQSVCTEQPTNADTEVLQPEDVKLNEVHDDEIDVIDLSNMKVQRNSVSSSQHVTVCFEVCIL